MFLPTVLGPAQLQLLQTSGAGKPVGETFCLVCLSLLHSLTVKKPSIFLALGILTIIYQNYSRISHLVIYKKQYFILHNLI